MAVPLENLLFSPGASLREIEYRYQLQSIAKNTQEMVPYMAAMCRAQVAEAAKRSEQQDYMSSMLADLSCDMSWIGQGIDRLNETALKQLSRIDNLNLTVLHGLQQVSEQLLNNQRTLNSILETISRPYETQALELRKKADEWLKHGMKNSGREQKEDYDDAVRLLQQTLENSIGKQDYVAWFQLGWLLWKHKKNAQDSEKAFWQSVRLSAPDRNQYHVTSLIHYAYMQYLRHSYQEAYETAKRALDVDQPHEVMFEVARYAAKTERVQEALNMLEKCVYLRPTTFETMLAEPDFAEIRNEIEGLRNRILTVARARAKNAIQECERTSNASLLMLHEIGQISQIPSELDTAVLKKKGHVNNLPYLAILDLERSAYDLRERTIGWARSYLEHLRQVSNNYIVRIHRDIEESQKASANHVLELEKQFKEKGTTSNVGIFAFCGLWPLSWSIMGVGYYVQNIFKQELPYEVWWMISISFIIIYLVIVIPSFLIEGKKNKNKVVNHRCYVVECEAELKLSLLGLNAALSAPTERCKKIDSLLERLGT